MHRPIFLRFPPCLVRLIFPLYSPFISAPLFFPSPLSLSLFPLPSLLSFSFTPHIDPLPSHVFPDKCVHPFASPFLFAPLFSIGDARIFVSSVPLSLHNLRVHRLFVSPPYLSHPHLFSLHTCSVFSIVADITLFEFSALYFLPPLFHLPLLSLTPPPLSINFAKHENSIYISRNA